MMSQLRLINSIFKMEVRAILAYRASFWINFLGTSLAHFGISYFLWSAIFQTSHATLIGGMNFSMMIFYSLLAPMTIKTVMGLQMLDVNQDIYTGSLNKFIIYPINYFQFKWIQQITHMFSRLMQLLIALIFFAIFITLPSEFHFKVSNVFLFFINLFISTTLFFALEILMEITAFWAENVWSLSVLLRLFINLFSGAWLPLSLFPKWSQPLMTILPFRGLVYIPVKTLMGDVGLVEWFQVQFISITWILIIGLMVSFIWKRGRALYSGVGI